MKSEFEQLKQQDRQVREQLAAAKQQLKQEVEVFAVRQQEGLETTLRELKEGQDALANLREEEDEANARLTATIYDKEQELVELEEQVEQKRAVFQAAQARLQTLEAKQSRLEAEVVTEQRKRDTLAGQVGGHEQTVTKQEVELRRLQGLLDQKTTALARDQQANDAGLQAAKAELQNLKSKHEKVKQQYANCKTKTEAAAAARLQAEAAAAARQIQQQFRSTRQRAQELDKVRTELGAQLEECRRTQAELKREKVELQKTFDDRSAEELSKLNADARQVQIAIQELRQQKLALEQEFGEKKEQADAMHTKYQAETLQLTMLRDDAKALQKHLQDLRTAAEQKRAFEASAKQQAQECEARALKLQEEIKARDHMMRMLREDLQPQIDERTKQLKEREAHITELMQQAQAVPAVVVDGALVNELLQKLEETKRRAAQLAQKTKRADAKHQQVMDSKLKLDAEHTACVAKLAQLQMAAGDARQHAARALAETTQCEAESQAKQKAVEAVQASLQQCMQGMGPCKAAARRCREDRAAAKYKIERLQARVRQLQAQAAAVREPKVRIETRTEIVREREPVPYIVFVARPQQRRPRRRASQPKKKTSKKKK